VPSGTSDQRFILRKGDTWRCERLNRPKAVTYLGPKTVTYAYDAVGNWLTNLEGGTTTTHVREAGKTDCR
jgi:hypothetical protein